MERPLPNSYWIESGSLLAGDAPTGATVEDTRQRLQRLLGAGIDSFIDLTQAGELPEYRSLLPAHVRYVRSPIADAEVPASIAQMRAIQSQLQAALAVGRRVYVHCRAGIGRTGTVMGCYLAEQGLDGPAALRQLNLLWRQSARSAGWPELPQTPEQAAYIVRWPRQRGPGARAAVWRTARGLRPHFHGALLGLAVGDGLGAGSHDSSSVGLWTDDTALALCLAESLLASSGFDREDQWLRYARWQRDGHLSAGGQCVGITAATLSALAPVSSGRPVGQLPSLEAAPLSRVAPVVLFYLRDRAEAIRRAREAAQFSHAGPRVCDACGALAAMVHAAIQGEPLERVLYPLASAVGRDGLDPVVAAAVRADPLQRPAGAAEPAVRALSLARWALATGGDFRAGALRAAQIAEDADVIGAAYGQLAGALYGSAAIPAQWLEALARRELIGEIADRLLEAALAGLPAADSGTAIG